MSRRRAAAWRSHMLLALASQKDRIVAEPLSDIIVQLRHVATSGSRAERRLAELCLADMRFVSMASIVDLAARADVSLPSVTRFCRNLGCAGVREFKFRLAQAEAIGGVYLDSQAQAAPAAPGDAGEIAGRVAAAAVAAIEMVAERVDGALLEQAAARLAAARSILVFGSGGSSSMAAVELQNRLFRLGLAVTAQSDGELQSMNAAMADAQTVAVAFSISGHARSVNEALAIARHYGAFTLAVTAPGSPLAEHAEMALTFEGPLDPDLYKPSPTRYALLALVDMLATATAEACGPRVFEGLRRIKQTVNTLKINDPRLPIGD
ncbi:DNA-binding MurR/RpiR family transcriptional regulator [Xanthomonas sacchari]|nr:DNA-binding MurR/RpiR family transcriptional regulator [Xanthomonas sacchari]